mgnify:FL=1
MTIIQDAKNRLVEGAWERMSLLKKAYTVLELWLSRETGLMLMWQQRNRHTNHAPYQPNMTIYRLLSKLEFKLRYIVYPKPKDTKK